MLQKIIDHHKVKRAYSEFAEQSELVYFGDVNQDDSATNYRGITYSVDSKVTNYVHGSINGYDLTAFLRRSLHRNHLGVEAKNTWTVLVIHLKVGGFPHLIFDTQKHDKIFYQSVFTRYPQMRRRSLLLEKLNPGSLQSFDLYMQPSSALHAIGLIDDNVLEAMHTRYALNDVELHDDKLFLFRREAPQRPQQLNSLLEEGLWLAETFEYRHSFMNSLKS